MLDYKDILNKRFVLRLSARDRYGAEVSKLERLMNKHDELRKGKLMKDYTMRARTQVRRARTSAFSDAIYRMR